MKQLFIAAVFLFVYNTSNAQIPEIIGIDPDVATIPEQLTVEISGANTHFALGTGTVVWFNQGSSTIFPQSVNEINNYVIEADFLFTNLNNPGIYNVNTQNYIDGHLVLPDAFTLNPNPNPPFLISVVPASAYAGEMISITITAENTHFTQGINYVYLYQGYHELWAYSITVISDEVIIADIPVTSGFPSGLYNLKVKSNWDGNLFLYNAFLVYPDPDPPYLTGIDPDNGTIPETLWVTISGNGTHFAQATGTTVKFEQGSSTIYSYNVVEINDEELVAQFSFDNFDNPGYYDVNTLNAIDGDLYLNNAFYLHPNPNPPQLISIEPDNAQPGDVLEVSISGQNTNFTQGTGTTVWLNMNYYNIYPYSTSVVNDELVKANFSFSNDVLLGSYDVNTHNWVDGHLILQDGFTIFDEIPSISYIEPVSGYVGESVSLSIFGENTHFVDAAYFNAWLIKQNLTINPVSLIAVSNNQIVADIDIPEDAEPGFWTVFATNSIDGDMYLENTFEIIDTSTFIQSNRVFKKLEVYPNPTNGEIFVAIESFDDEEVTIQLQDFFGSKLYEGEFAKSEKIYQELMLPSLSSGIYYLKFISSSGSVVKKIVVK